MKPVIAFGQILRGTCSWSASPCLEQGEAVKPLMREKEWGPKVWNQSKRAWQPMTEGTLLQGQWEQGSDEDGHIFYINPSLDLSSRAPPPGPELVYYTKGVIIWH